MNIFHCTITFVLFCYLIELSQSGFTQSFYGHRDEDEEEIPQGASTLAFVFDITGSMYDDLVQVIEGAARILNTILARREKVIYNYVLVPFHDPDIGPITVTTDPDLFQRHLKDLYVQGGGDCPEMSIGAIKLALDVCLPNSHIYIFTDARAKDYYLLNDVLKLIQRKQSQVVFVLTGDCGNHSHPGYQAYERIASTSSGQVFHLRKSDVDEVLNFVRVSLQARKVNLFAVDRASGTMKEFEFDIDGSLREFTISVAGENPIISVMNSRGELVDETSGLNELLSHKNISIVNIKNPPPGHWKLRVSSDGPHTIRATGLSKIDFVHGFSRQPTENLLETYYRPLKGTFTYLLVNATDLVQPATFESVKLIDLEGNSLQKIPLYRFPGSNMFNASTFYPPDEYFYLKVSGIDEFGYPLERITSTAINAQLPDVPEVNTRPRVNGYYDEDVVLRCYIQSLVPFSVVWYKENIQISQEHHFPQTTEITLTVPEVTNMAEGWYSCNATNTAGSSSSAIFLDVKAPPPSISKPENISGVIGRQAILPCDVDSVVEHNISWTRLVIDEHKKGFMRIVPVPDIARIIVYSNGSLVINGVTSEDEGWYRCIVANEGGSVQEHTYLFAYYPPTITIHPQEEKFIKGSQIIVACHSEGYPIPEISWMWSQTHKQNFLIGKNVINGSHLIINHADHTDEGRYDCVAKNVAGSKVQSAFLKYIEVPVITLPEHEYLVKDGDQAILRCIAEGIPDPKVIWYKGNTEIRPLSYIHLTPEGTLVIYGVQELDAGNYTCVAHNEAGKTEESVILNIGSIPSIVQLPVNTTIEITKNGTLPCIATGIPKPKISWKYQNDSSLGLKSRHFITDDGYLFIKNSEISDKGVYICVAENKFGSDEHKFHLNITGIVKPVIASVPSIINVMENHDVTLNCSIIEGNPMPEIKWFQNNRNLAGGQDLEVHYDGTLEFRRVTKSHEAYYKCVASNVGGNISEETYLNVQTLPSISNNSQEYFAVVGTSITLPCDGEGDPKPFISWERNGFVLVRDQETYNTAENGSLLLHLLQENDTGVYTCTASNVVGTTKKSLYLSVLVPPKIIQTRNTFEVIEGKQVMLPCKVYAVPPATVRWRREEKTFHESNFDSFTLSSGSIQFTAKLSDAGKYICEAMNVVSTAISTVNLNVYVPPQISSEGSSSIVVMQDQEIFITCNASGHPAPLIRWEKNGRVIYSSQYVGDENSLYFPSAAISDSGQYTCIAENHAGSATHTQNLIVYVPPKIVSHTEQYISTTVGNEITVSCFASGFPKPHIIWKKNDQGLTIAQNETLHILNAEEADAGNYTCSAENLVGKDSMSFNVTIFVPPSWKHENPKRDVEIIEGNNITLDCSVLAYPQPDVVWYKNNEIFNLSSKRYSKDSEILVLRDAISSDSGNYVCLIQNTAGRISNEFNVNVLVPPNFKDPSQNIVHVQEGEHLNLDCTVDGNPLPQITWKKNKQVISSLTFPHMKFIGEGSQLNINNSRRTDSGKYSCTVQNKVGFDSREFFVTVLVHPHIQGDVSEEKESIVFQPLHLSCYASGVPTPNITWFKDGEVFHYQNLSGIFISDNGRKLEIMEPSMTDSGFYSCSASNSIGEAKKHFKLNILDSPQIRDQNAVDAIDVKEREQLILECKTFGNPKPQVVWLKDGRYISSSDINISFQNEEHVLHIKKVSEQDSGRYTCLAANKIGSTEKDFSVTVFTSPRFEILNGDPKRESTSQEVLENLPVQLSCPVSGNPLPKITWLKDGQLLQLSKNSPHIKILENGKHLYVRKSLVADAGKYVCIAENIMGEKRKEFDLIIVAPPNFINSDVKDVVEVEENKIIFLDCNVTGSPLPTITWLKDDVDLTPNDDNIFFSKNNMFLTIEYAEKADSGKYTCIATNVAGSTEKEFEVDILASPDLEIPDNEVDYDPVVHINRPYTFTCPLTGNPEPDILWFKNGQVIDPGNDPNIYLHPGKKKISLLRTEIFDGGIYSCLASNRVGEKILDFNLELFIPPRIDGRKLKTVFNIKEGDSLTIECPVNGHPKPVITWIKDSDVLLPGMSTNFHFLKDSQSLHLKQTLSKDAGRYSCVAGNEAGTSEQDFKVNVLVPPTFEDPKALKDAVSTVLNRPVTIHCPVFGRPSPVIKWYKNGKLLNPYSDPNVVISPDGRQLKIFHVRIIDAAKYVCKAVNDAGKMEKEFVLGVQVPPRILHGNNLVPSSEESDGKQILKAVENGTLLLECHVDGNPIPVILWLKDGHLLSSFNETSSYRLHFQGQELEIISVTQADKGHYTCIASNIAGTKEKDILVDILVAPKIQGLNEELRKVLSNRPFILDCPVESHPPAKITWLKDNEIIEVGKYDFIQTLEDGKKLKFLKPNLHHQGRFTCIAENDVGIAEKNYNLSVQVPPTIKPSNTSFLTIENHKAFFKCFAYGNPHPVVVWMKDGDLISEDLQEALKIQMEEDKQLLTIPIVKLHHGGNYKCIASNSVGFSEKNFDLSVRMPPKIINASDLNVSVLIQKPLELLCEVIANPQAFITWGKDGQVLNHSSDPFISILNNGQKLQIFRVREHDEGIYSCEARNIVGHEKRSFVVNVLVPPRINSVLREDSQLIFTEGNSTELECYTHGNPNPNISWLINGNELHFSNNTRVQFLNGNQHLRILNVHVNDTGVYTCIATNGLGSQTKHFNVFVQVPPTISNELNIEPIGMVNVPYKIHCEAFGNPVPIISWMKNGLPIDHQTDTNLYVLAEESALLIRWAQIDDVGKYTCIASSSAGQDEKDFDFKVHTLPSINNAGVNPFLTAIINHPITLECPVSGIPFPNITWLKDGVSIDQFHLTSSFQVLEGGQKLRIQSSKTNDAGVFECVASNGIGSDKIKFTVDILAPPQINDTDLINELEVLEGENVVIDCPVQSSSYISTILWFKNNKMININEMSPHFSFSDDSKSLKIMRAQSRDTGIYKCFVSNPAGEMEHESSLLVIVPAIITYPLETITNTYVTEHQPITLECIAVGYPEPVIEWLKRGHSVAERQNVSFPSLGKVRLFDVTLHDAGTYTCQASNSGGVDKRSYNLNVYVPPVINALPGSFNKIAQQGSDVRLDCPAEGHPFPRVMWYKDSQMLIPGQKTSVSNHGLSITLHQATVADAGKYTCMALNEVGDDELEYFVKIQVPPSIEQIATQGISNIVGQPVRIVCDAEGIPFPSITWFKNGIMINETSNHFSYAGGGRYLDFQSVQSFDTGLYNCKAENDVGIAEKEIFLQVMVPPDINTTNEFSYKEVVIGNPVYIECQASGVPPPTISWLKNGLPLQPKKHIHLLKDNHVLWFVSAMATDSSEYTCIASNNAGSVKQDFNVSVLVPPTFMNYLDVKKLTVQAGHPFHITCLVSGVPEPSIVWSKDGKFLSTEYVQIIDGKLIQSQEAQLHHAGEYTCEASNVAGKSSKTFNLQVTKPPTIEGSSNPTFIASVTKDPAIFECLSSGIPTPNIIWLKDGIPIFPEYNSNIQIRKNGTELFIPHSQQTDSGSYQCLASNSIGNSSKAFTLTVLESPSIKSRPTERKTILGENSFLECEFYGFPQPQISWLKDNFPLSSSSALYNVLPTGSLVLLNTRLQDSGNYTCVVSNEVGSASSNIYLQVLAPPQIENSSTHLKIFHGQPGNLHCNVKGHPKPTVMWHKNSVLISNSSDLYILENGSLYIPVVQKENNGTYTCVAENEAGYQHSNRFVEVLIPPRIEDSLPAEYVSYQGQPVLLKCEASGFPAPSFFWEKNDVQLEQDNIRYKILSSGYLHISFSQPSDIGIYTCIAKNEAGSDTRTVKLTVQAPPVIVKNHSNSIITIKGRSLEIPCHADGFPPPHINWQFNGGDITASSKIQHTGNLVISNIQPEDSGRYSCIAINSAGRDFSATSVQVQVPPTIFTLPKSHDISVGDSINLLCEARGMPLPTVTWFMNNTWVSGQSSIRGRNQLIIENATKENQGTYICLAQNAAGERKAVAAVRVRAPPTIFDSPGVQNVRLQEAVMLDCAVNGDPFPNIIWTKNGQKLELNHRIQQIINGSLMIYNSLDEDSGQYKCIASNTFGSAEGVAELVIRREPEFIMEPHDVIVELGDNINMDCKATGEPKPNITWNKDGKELSNHDRLFIFPNSTLRIIAVQASDEQAYSCVAHNDLGSISAEAHLTVRVHGQWSQWLEWEACSSSCGDGFQYRHRICDNPTPKNGGKMCMGISRETKKCENLPCPIDGDWGNWVNWDDCSVTCGVGFKKRYRQCNNPSPKFGGKTCNGTDSEIESCFVKKCPVDGAWNSWSSWAPCSATCGEGISIRTRLCNNPEPSNGGKPCFEEEAEKQVCKLKECEVHGEWGHWNEWSLCSSSCGGGSRQRTRSCDSPFPEFGGRSCSGSYVQVDYCNNYPCPVNGEWSPWSTWGDCSSSCNNGQRKKFRSCNNPAPDNGGRDCSGSSQEMENCNMHLCPVYGNWGEWGEWSACSSTCGEGYRQRSRICRSASHSLDGEMCLGDSLEFEDCGEEACDAIPVNAVGHLIGAVNGIDLGVSKLMANMTTVGMEQIVTSIIQDIPKEIALWMKLLVPLLAPIYWTTAYEVGQAVNGYTLTKGFFRRETRVSFASGEALHMTHVARGLNKRGQLLIDIVVNGEVPNFPPDADIIISPYSEDYIQIGPGSIYAFSTRTYRYDKHVFPYFWNHTIIYDETLGKMPYLVQRLLANGIRSTYDPDSQSVYYIISSVISKGVPDDQCPDGYSMNSVLPYCVDIDECEHFNLCSHICNNVPGSYLCLCPAGMSLNVNGTTCEDIDECLLGIGSCQSTHKCVNSIGSYNCYIVCEEGYIRTPDGSHCQDINECEISKNVCNQKCINTIGSYHCECRKGYHLVGKGSCLDIDECQLTRPPCSHICMNIHGSYKCSCPEGFTLIENICIDINECELGDYTCSIHEICENKEGGYKCILACPKGYEKTQNGSCIDINECDFDSSVCHYSQICSNTPGSYHCSCFRGYHSDGPGKPCKDVNECLQNPNPCSYKCHDIRGDYECICPPGQKRLSDRKTCAGLEYLEPSNPKKLLFHDVFSDRNASDQHTPNTMAPPQFPAYQNSLGCSLGFYNSQGICQDINECQITGICQHLCENTVGSFRCICPAGYKLGASGRSCEDIDECLEQNINCGVDSMCFNMKGSFECIRTPCPPNYEKDLVTGYCKLECVKANIACPPGIKYAEFLAFKTVALSSGILAYQDLVRLVAYDQDGIHLPNTQFSIIENETGVPFRIRPEGGKGVLFTQKDMDSNKEYQIKVQAVSYDNSNQEVQYTTKFLVFVAVSKYPY